MAGQQSQLEDDTREQPAEDGAERAAGSAARAAGRGIQAGGRKAADGLGKQGTDAALQKAGRTAAKEGARTAKRAAKTAAKRGARQGAKVAANGAASAALGAATGGTGLAVRVGVEVGWRLLRRFWPYLLVAAIVLGYAVFAAIVGVQAQVAAEQAAQNQCSPGGGGGSGGGTGGGGPGGGGTSHVYPAPPKVTITPNESEDQRYTALTPVYKAAARQFNLGSSGWAYLAGINDEETKFGLDDHTSTAGAEGWMQFEPSTFAIYAVQLQGLGKPTIDNFDDAIYAAANMMHSDGAPNDWDQAIFSYNHSDAYVANVQNDAQSFLHGQMPTGGGGGSGSTGTGGTTEEVSCAPTVAGVQYTDAKYPSIITSGQYAGEVAVPRSAPAPIQALLEAGNQIIGKPYPEPDQHYNNASMTGGLWPAYDCSASVSYVLYKAGLMSSTAKVSGEFENWDDPGEGKWLTVYSNQGHVFLLVGNRNQGVVLNTAWYASKVIPSRPSTGPRWQPVSTVGAQLAGDTYGGFKESHSNMPWDAPNG